MTKVYGDYDPNDVIIVDLETQNITPQEPHPPIRTAGWLWCGGSTDDLSISNRIDDLLEDHLPKAALMVGHNIIGFDIPVILAHSRKAKLIPDDLLILDTMLLSQMIYADREGGHGLDNLAAHFGCPIKKVEIDFNQHVTIVTGSFW